MATLIQRMNALGLLTLLLAGCWGSGVKPPDVKMNPSPKERYEITLMVQDPPAAIQKVEGSIQFNIKDTSCMPTADRIAGVQPKSSFVRPVEFKRTGDNLFTGHVYADWIRDEDYYGRGMCRWSPTVIWTQMRLGNVSQTAILRGNKILSEESQINLCRRDQVTSYGCQTPIDAVDDNKSALIFTATLISRRENE